MFLPRTDYNNVPITLNPYQGLKLNLTTGNPDAVLVPITLNPYQGLKLIHARSTSESILVPITLNPYQGLKQLVADSLNLSCAGSNYSKSLSGIETGIRVPYTLYK